MLNFLLYDGLFLIQRVMRVAVFFEVLLLVQYPLVVVVGL